ncbi:hypothetical protein ACIQXF_02025 [Lysinibacillus sp. NPDC097231]|uniref:hypothetical protein n=1 Tax=Lysinibacillus sp. NPDC097231 TaxID=3364142 RepID=UPI003825F265
MKRYIIVLLIIYLVVALNIAEAKNEEYEIVSTLSKEDITLSAKKIGSLYRDFKIDFKGATFYRPFWVNDTNPTYAPQIYYEDINKDGKKELIVILTKGYGTGVLDEEVHVFRNKNGLMNILVDNPMAIIYKNIKTKLTTEKAEISLYGKVFHIDIPPLNIQRTNLFDDIAFGEIIRYEVKDKQLIARVSAQVSPASFIGEVVIVYEYRDKMYQAKSVSFQPY